MLCKSCDAVYVNGVLCHESGCPDSWVDKEKECKWCGCNFYPDKPRQDFCSDECWSDYNGFSDDDEAKENRDERDND